MRKQTSINQIPINQTLMMDPIKIVLAQLNVMVGAIEQNVDKIIASAQQAKKQHDATLMVCSELTLTGYPPEDLLFRSGFISRVEQQLQRLCADVSDIDIIVGYPKRINGQLFNAAGLISNGKIIAEYLKRELPNYSVFDEKRYFNAGNEVCVLDYYGMQLGITICEDIWHDGPVEEVVAAGAELIVNLNASPYHTMKIPERRNVVCAKAKKLACPVIYVNQIGGQDELVFDGASFACDANGEVVHQTTSFEETLSMITVQTKKDARLKKGKIAVQGTQVVAETNLEQSVYQALVLGVRDYVTKNGFKGVVLGLSGGIDSGLTLAIAVDALGAEQVTAIMMPFKYTSDMSKTDAEQQATMLGVDYHVVSIEPMYNTFVQQLKPIFTKEGKGKHKDTTEENIQARCRGLLLMAYSNKLGHMVLTTGNKSEMAVGYATLYGDMAGGYSAIKDVPKTLVYKLAEYRNSISPAIPERVITRPPSAELAPNQLDADSLPPYDVLDPILELYVELDTPPADIITKGYSEEDVKRVVSLVNRNEYKRQQAAPGVRISKRAFGRDRRYPITSGFKVKI